MVGTVVKTKVCELGDEIREVFLMKLRKDMAGVVREVDGKIRYLVRFQDGGEKKIPPSLLVIVDVTSEVEEEIKVREVEIIPEIVEELG